MIAGVRSPFTVMVIAPVLLYLQNSSGNEALANWIPLVYACLVIVVLRVAPQGIGGIRLRLTRQLTAWSVRSPEGMQGVRHDRSPCRNRLKRSYGGVHAVRDVSLRWRSGAIHGSWS